MFTRPFGTLTLISNCPDRTRTLLADDSEMQHHEGSGAE